MAHAMLFLLILHKILYIYVKKKPFKITQVK